MIDVSKLSHRMGCRSKTSSSNAAPHSLNDGGAFVRDS